MMSLETIQAMADDAGRIAAEKHQTPYVLFNEDDILRMPGGERWNGRRQFPFPNLGSYTPPKWRKVDELFVDSSGFGDESEPALTARQLNQKLLELLQKYKGPVGIAITEVGQFQLYLGVFRKR